MWGGMASLNLFLLAMTIVYVLLVLYMRRGWLHIPIFKVNEEDRSYPMVSVLIAARNEEMNIGRTLDCLIAQDFPKCNMEIIVVDDHSTDGTADVVRSYVQHGVKLLQLDEGDKLNSYKKLAISKAIAIAEGNIIVTTDADCRMGKRWLTNVIQFMEANKLDMVSSPVVYDEEKSLFERLQTLEFMYLIGLGAAGIGNDSPTTCNGANLAYRKSTFYEVGGFNGIDDVASGDDELLLHKIAEKYPNRIGFCKSRDAIVYTDAKPTLSSFLSQRKRWASKSTKYKDKRVVVLGVLIWFFNLAFLIGTIHLLCTLPDFYWFFVISAGLKLGVEVLFLIPVATFAKRSNLLFFLPLLTLIHTLYFVYIGVAGNIGKYDWKGRQVK